MTNASAAVETQDRVTVLVVNDRREILEALERFLNRFENVRVVGLAQGTEEAIDLAVLSRPRVVLCDFIRENSRTLERVRLLRIELPQSCIIVMSYDDDDSGREAALQAGASLFISKFKLGDEFIPVLERCLPLN